MENKKWGSRFPVIMNELYQGKVKQENIERAIEELNIIKKELQTFSPDKVIWDIEDLSKQPPWGSNISKDITNLSNYFYINITYAIEKACRKIYVNDMNELCSRPF